MKDTLSEEEKRNVLREIEKMGFDEKTILAAIDEVPLIRILSADKVGLLLIDVGDQKDITFSFRFGKEPTETSWKLNHVLAMIQYGTELNEFGVDILSRRYELSSGQWPKREKMIEDLEIRLEKIKAQERVHTNTDLSLDFMRLGFNDMHEMLKKASHHADLTYLRTSEKAELPFGNGNEKFNFEFIIKSPVGNRRPQIILANAFLSISGENALDTKLKTERTFVPINGRLPHKNYMTERILASLEVKPDLFNRIKASFNLRDSTFENEHKPPNLSRSRNSL